TSPAKAATRGDDVGTRPPRPRPQRRVRWLAAAGAVAAATVIGAFPIWRQSTGGGELRLSEINVPADQDAANVGGPAPDSLAAAALDVEPGDSGGEQLGNQSQPSVPRQERAVPAAGEPSGRPDELAAERSHAEQARSDAQLARDAAQRAGADTIFPGRFAQVQGLFNGAESDLRAGRIVRAALAFATAKNDFEELEGQAVLRLEELAAAAAAAEQAAADPGQLDPPAPEDEAGGEHATPVPPSEAITALIEGYRQALEASDMARLEREIYQAAIPAAERRDLYEVWFQRATNLSVSIEVGNTDIGPSEAEVRTRQKMSYRLARTGEEREATLELRMFFVRTDLGWRLARVER
ncbi:MAG: hypothetical protein PVG79_14280, partial [Gemmatimonadales bacterium]